MRSYNDDLVLACAVGCWVRDTALTNNQRNIEYSKAFLSSFKKNGQNLDTRIPGMLMPKNMKLKADMKQHSKNQEQFPWLFKG